MPNDVVIKTTCARDCYDACGIAVHKENGAITKVLGDPDHAISRGKLCGKCAIAYNGAWRDTALRLQDSVAACGRERPSRIRRRYPGTRRSPRSLRASAS